MFADDFVNSGIFAPGACLPSLRFANAAAGFTQKAALDDPIFKRVERDYGQPPAVTQLRDRGGNETLERPQLIVDRDSERLKRSCGRMYAPSARNVERSDDNVRKLLCGGDRFTIALSYDCASDLTSASFLSVFKDQIRQLVLSEFIHKFRRGQLAVLIHSHIERRVGDKAKSSFSSLDLHRRNSEISKNPADLSCPIPVQHRSDAFKVRVDQLNPAFKHQQALSRQSERFEIAVYSNHACVRRGSENRPGVSAESNRAIDERPSFSGSQPLDDLCE